MSEAIAKARIEADLARARLNVTVDEVRVRLTPRSLGHDAVDAVKVRAAEGVVIARRNPLPVAAALVAAVLFVARKPLLRRFRRKAHETADKATSLTTGRARARTKGSSR